MPTHEEKQKSLARLGEEFLAAVKKMTPDEMHRLVLAGDEPASVYLEHIVGHLSRVGGQRRLIAKLTTAAALGPAEKEPLPDIDDQAPYVVRRKGAFHPESPEWYYYRGRLGYGSKVGQHSWESSPGGVEVAFKFKGRADAEATRKRLLRKYDDVEVIALADAKEHPGSGGM
jgi:hypothetical protein